MPLLELIERAPPVARSRLSRDQCSHYEMNRTFLVEQPKHMLERSERAVDIRGDLDRVQFIPNGLSCCLRHRGTSFSSRNNGRSERPEKKRKPHSGESGASVVPWGTMIGGIP